MAMGSYKKPIITYQVKAELVDGSVVVLEKDCDCVIHDGPHWVYRDVMDRQMNMKCMGRVEEAAKAGQEAHGKKDWQGVKQANLSTLLSAAGLAQEEMLRLKEKQRQMESRGIVRLIPPFEYTDPQWSWFTYRQTIALSQRTPEQRQYDRWHEDQVNPKIKCPECKGRGRHPDPEKHFEICPHCSGKKYFNKDGEPWKAIIQTE